MKNKLPQNFCILPWTAMEVQPNGTVKPCCMYKDTLKNENGQEFKVDTHSMEEIWNSPAYDEIRQRFLAGTQPRGCHRCWMEELSGKSSKRIRDNKKYRHHIKDKSIFDNVQPRYLDLKLGNICNLKCRICSPQYSSKWITEQKRYDKIDGISKEYNRLDWPEKSEYFWKNIEELMPYIEHLDFTGGEPFMIQEHFQLLEKFVKSGYAKKVTLHYNTNGTQLPLEAMNSLFPKFKEVDVHFSIDGVGKHYEYQRHPAKWDVAIHTLTEFKKYIQKLETENRNNFTIQICHTVNIFNVYYLPEFLEWANDIGIDVYLNSLHEPMHYNITCLPVSYKKIIEAKLLRFTDVDLKQIIKFMNSSSHPRHFKNLTSHITRMDIVRHESFGKVFPEIAGLFEEVTV